MCTHNIGLYEEIAATLSLNYHQISNTFFSAIGLSLLLDFDVIVAYFVCRKY